ncbi:protein tyrosine kinase domain-containing protein [Rhizoctonia solani AG-1 IA]|uniref:Protein tyrosine kinase domain-containing protein n=1 Tax=Thanatephorus cucumeris (strain AG1-IA) TaxID=983506 RepID=L8WQQ0_THACA|nr:protein tyrosine kinase domain-containing protein [Rhizoctonia solani AG-1 IA]
MKPLVSRQASESVSEEGSPTFADDVYALGTEIIKGYTSYTDIPGVHIRQNAGKAPPRPVNIIPGSDAGDHVWDILCKCWLNNSANRPLTVLDLVGYFEKYDLVNYTDLLHQHHIETAMPFADGALANIYKVKVSRTRYLAVKCVKHETPYKKLKRAARELSCWSSYKHKNILPILGFAIVKGDLAMVSRWMKNGYVTEYVVNNPNCDRSGLASANLTEPTWPNVLISDNGVVQITDFGVSVMDHQEIKFSSTSSRGGTQRWLAPEILLGQTKSTKEADVYALSMEIYTGEQPYGSKNWLQLMVPVVNGELRPSRPVTLSPDIFGYRVWRLMNQCWLENWSARPTSKDVYERLCKYNFINTVPPGPQPDSEKLIALSNKIGVVVKQRAIALSKRGSTTATQGLKSAPAEFVESILEGIDGAYKGSYGWLIFTQKESTVQHQSGDIMPGDIVVMTDVVFKRRRFGGLESRTISVSGELFGVLGEFEPKKRKLKPDEPVSYCLDDLKNGVVQDPRVEASLLSDLRAFGISGAFSTATLAWVLWSN